MPELFFSIDQETQTMLVVELSLKQDGPRRVLYKEELERAAQGKEREAVDYLIREELKRLGIPFSSPQATTIPFNRVKLPLKCSQEAIKRLALSGKWMWKKKPLLFDPFTPFEFYYQVAPQENGDLCVEGRWRLNDKEGSLSECEWVFPGDPCWVIKEGVVYPIAGGIDWKWIQRVFPSPTFLTGVKKQQFSDQFDEGEVPDGAPRAAWGVIGKGTAALDSTSCSDPFPYLVLTDRTGAFANLGMDYGPRGKWLMAELPHTSWRNGEAERSWEKDLIETDFIKKIVGTSHYYCPLDQVAKSLTFLLEIGWPIFDYRGKRVVRQSGDSLSLQALGDRILIKGTLNYAEHEADIKDLMGAFNRRERFLTLSDQTVALLDSRKIEQKWGDIFQETATDEGIVVPKRKLGLLASLLQQPGVKQDPEIQTMTAALKIKQEAGVNIQPSSLFVGTLHPYQLAGLDWLAFLRNNDFHGILADEMGLGKTVQVLAFLSLFLPETSLPCLIVVPTSLLFNWRREMEKFLPEIPVWVHTGKERLTCDRALSTKKVIVTSYALLRLDADLLKSMSYSLVILDEAQMIKNPDSQIAKTAYALQAVQRLALTGTPLENSPDDVWSLFHFLMPDLLGERKVFRAALLAGQSDGRYLVQIKKKVSPFMLRRRKDQIFEQLPEKIAQSVWVEMPDEQRAIYEEWIRKHRSGLLKKVAEDGVSAHRMEIFEAILRLRQICCHPHLVDSQTDSGEEGSAKMQRLLADLEEAIGEGRKVLVYSQFTQMLRLIEKQVVARGWTYVYLDGSTKDREGVVEKFQQDPQTSLFLISLKAGGVGLNLTAADYVFLYDPWWNDAVEEQAIGRAHRLGRTGTVIARRYLTAFTIEEKMMRLKEHKTALAKGLLDFDQTISQLTLDDLTELLT